MLILLSLVICIYNKFINIYIRILLQFKIDIYNNFLRKNMSKPKRFVLHFFFILLFLILFNTKRKPTPSMYEDEDIIRQLRCFDSKKHTYTSKLFFFSIF